MMHDDDDAAVTESHKTNAQKLMSSSTSTLAKVWAVPLAVASTAAVDVVGLGLDEPAGYEPHRRVVLLTALVALCSVFPATLDRVVIAAVAVELEDEYSDFFSLRNQRSFLAALATFTECLSSARCGLCFPSLTALLYPRKHCMCTQRED